MLKEKYKIGHRVQLKYKYMTKGKALNQIQGSVVDFILDPYYETLYTVRFDDGIEDCSINESELIKL